MVFYGYDLKKGPKVIVAKINGGLGNQLFQYAAGRALAHCHQTELVLDLSWFDNRPLGNTPWKYELHHYPNQARITNPAEQLMCRYYQGRLVRHIPFLPRKWKHLREPHFQYDPHFLHYPNDAYLDGYWQSSCYFEGIGNLISAELQPIAPPGERNVELMAAMQSTNSVALHIRRGDYLSNPTAVGYHGVCSLDYYQQAVQLIASKVPNPHFYVFSDDLEWAKLNLALEFPVSFVGHNVGDQAFQDLRLISHCQHQIIANSSFSWWGAWLNPHLEKIVIGPKKWFLVNKDTSTLFPPHWLMI